MIQKDALHPPGQRTINTHWLLGVWMVKLDLEYTSAWVLFIYLSQVGKGQSIPYRYGKIYQWEVKSCEGHDMKGKGKSIVCSAGI